MSKSFVRFAPHAFALLRIFAGLMFALHGYQKLFGFPPPPPLPATVTPPPYALMVTAGSIELVCGLLISAGLFGSYAAFLASGQMAVAYFMVHFPKIFESLVYFFPISGGGNGGEPAILYCFIFLYIAMSGSGAWSLDAMFGLSKTKMAG